jgi:hypothetical protein
MSEHTMHVDCVSAMGTYLTKSTSAGFFVPAQGIVCAEKNFKLPTFQTLF